MPEDFTSLVERLHQAQRRLEELNAIERHQEELNELHNTLREVKDTLNAISNDAGEVQGDINEVREQLQEALDRLEDAHQGFKDTVQGLSDAAGQVAEGVGQFSETAGQVAGKLGELDSAITQVRELIELGEGSPSEIIGGFNNYFQQLVDKLGPLIDKIPGLGAFIRIWTMAIENIRVSAMAIEAEVARRNRIMQEVFGQDLYQTPLTESQQRRQEIERLEQEIDQLQEQVAAHPDNPGTAAQQAAPDPNAEAYTDERAAEQIAQRETGMDAAELQQAREDLSWARWNLRQAWQRLRELEGERDLLDSDIRQAQENVRLAQIRLEGARANRAHLQDQLDRARNDLERVQRQRAEIDERIQRAEEELRTRYQEYQDKLHPVQQFNDKVRQVLEDYRPGIFDQNFLPDWYTNPNYWSFPELGQIRSRLNIPTGPVRGTISRTPPVERQVSQGPSKTMIIAGAGGLLALAIAIPVVLVLSNGGGEPVATEPKIIATRAPEPTDPPQVAVAPTQVPPTEEPVAQLATPTLAATPLPEGMDSEIAALIQEFRADLIAYLADRRGDFIYSIPGVPPGNPGPDVDIVGFGRATTMLGQQDVDQLFNQQFPCDGMANGFFVVCPMGPDRQPPPPGEWLLIINQVQGPIPRILESDSPRPKDRVFFQYQYGAVFDADGQPENNWQPRGNFTWDFYQGTDTWYQVHGQLQEGQLFLNRAVVDTQQRFAEMPTGARAFVGDESIVFAIPGSELPVDSPYRVSAFRSEPGSFAPEVSAGDVSGANPTEPLFRADELATRVPATPPAMQQVEPPSVQIGP